MGKNGAGYNISCSSSERYSKTYPAPFVPTIQKTTARVVCLYGGGGGKSRLVVKCLYRYSLFIFTEFLFFKFLFSVTARDVLGTVPVESSNINKRDAFNSCPVVRQFDLLNDLRCRGSCILEVNVSEYLQTKAVGVVHQDDRTAVV